MTHKAVNMREQIREVGEMTDDDRAALASALAAEFPPRRQTPSERQHEALLAALHRTAPASAAPSFKVAQVKATGGATVYEWDAYVPVGAEYETAEAAFDAVCSFADRLSIKYPATAVGAEVKEAPSVERTARAAAAIARAKAS